MVLASRSFSALSPDKAGGNTYGVTLKESSKEFKDVKPGVYYLFAANCGTNPLVGLKVSGTVKAKSSHGYASPDAWKAKDGTLYFGLANLLCAVLVGIWAVMNASFSEGLHEKLFVLTAFSLSAVRLLMASPVALDTWNTTGYQFSGAWLCVLFEALQACALFTVYEFMSAQYHFTTIWSISTTDKIAGVGPVGMDSKDVICCGVYNIAIFVAYIVGCSPGDQALLYRPSSSFFKDALEESPVKTGSTSQIDGWRLLEFKQGDIVKHAGVLIVLSLCLGYAERREASLHNDFCKLVLSPFRTTTMTIGVATLICHTGLYIDGGQTNHAGEILHLFIVESALLIVFIMLAYYLSVWDVSMKMGISYNIVSENDLELAQMEDGDDIEKAVDNYDPDQLFEKRQLE